MVCTRARQGAKCGCACCCGLEARPLELVSPPWPSEDWIGYFRAGVAFRDLTRPLSRWLVSFTVLRPRRVVMSLAKRRGREFRAGGATTGTLLLSIVLSVVVLCAVLVLILPWPLPYHQSMDEIMHDRTAYLLEQCRSASVTSGGLGTTPRYYYQQAFHNYFYQPRVGLLWCSISKVASSSWMYQFNRWAGVPRETIDLMATEMKALARVHYPLPSRADVEQMKLLAAAGVANERLMVVRDPMDRFVSAYEDLIVRPKSSNYLHLRRFIFREVHGVNVMVSSGSSSRCYRMSIVCVFCVDFLNFILFQHTFNMNYHRMRPSLCRASPSSPSLCYVGRTFWIHTGTATGTCAIPAFLSRPLS